MEQTLAVVWVNFQVKPSGSTRSGDIDQAPAPDSRSYQTTISRLVQSGTLTAHTVVGSKRCKRLSDRHSAREKSERTRRSGDGLAIRSF